jgi:hypothetical protein
VRSSTSEDGDLGVGGNLVFACFAIPSPLLPFYSAPIRPMLQTTASFQPCASSSRRSRSRSRLRLVSPRLPVIAVHASVPEGVTSMRTPFETAFLARPHQTKADSRDSIRSPLGGEVRSTETSRAPTCVCAASSALSPPWSSSQLSPNAASRHIVHSLSRPPLSSPHPLAAGIRGRFLIDSVKHRPWRGVCVVAFSTADCPSFSGTHLSLAFAIPRSLSPSAAPHPSSLPPPGAVGPARSPRLVLISAAVVLDSQTTLFPPDLRCALLENGFDQGQGAGNF